ncbi:GIY-YIG nuclease family protein [Sneathia sanguinegens]|uniref:GIY-YIG nuclease family protein n=1 Tax=Sneathia sanguinegens TaxID=40543 RepID=UPI0029075AA5|nr:GIY-YIG nuclease family protein [Sneathia sanguinegens]MDU7496808.1 GIY-YIG nuclease family protein [Sneathia sanguinegens]
MFIEPKIGHIVNSCTKDEKLKKLKDLNCKLLTEYPVVYIHNWKDKNENKYSVYIGETNDIYRRTEQHYEVLKKNNNSWQKNLNNAGLYIIGHEHFNKSLTLDIENKLMLYLTSIDNVTKVCNGRGNPQKEYYTSDEYLEKLYKMIKLMFVKR